MLGGTGANYGKIANPDAPVWRAGANVSTQLKTEVPLVINGKTVAPGTYTMFIDLKPNNWTLIVSNWTAQTRYDPKNTAELWGAYGYTPDKDVVRAPMTLGDAAVLGRAAHVGFHRHERRRRQADDHVGQGGRLGAVQDHVNLTGWSS